MANRLSNETSPYLKQHQDNPVDWYPWGEEALERARREDKPILLSVGYSACHWCHVMAHESFENEQTARVMNERFVNIKVDREERPDLDQIYQNVAQALTRSGGWPLTVFLTPDLKPFFGGTYFPPEDRWGRPGFPRVLGALAEAYRNERSAVNENAERLMDALRQAEAIPSVEGAEIREEGLRSAAAQILVSVDLEWGGLSGHPKFPNPMVFEFLWRFALRYGDARAAEAVMITLDRMACGGIYDQIGGGFHRYSVDGTWSVPHFEKMLYDNGLLLKLYSEVLVTGGDRVSDERRKLYLETARGTVVYLRREMRTEDGLFYAAQDADSEGEEGKFFVWDKKDLGEHLELEAARAFAHAYGVTAEGNFEHTGKTVLWQAHPAESTAREMGWDIARTEIVLEKARAQLLVEREKRVKPGLDDKVLTAWNALALEGWVWAARAEAAAGRTEEVERLTKEAWRTWESLVGAASRAESELWSTVQQGAGRFNAYLDDYAFLARATLALANLISDEADVRRLQEHAAEWVSYVVREFSTAEEPGYAFTASSHEALPVRPRTLFDQAIPSGSAVTLECLEALESLGVEVVGVDPSKELHRQWQALFPLASRNALGTGAMLSAALTALGGSAAVSGPGAERLCTLPGVHRKVGDGAREYLVCRRGVCSLPLKDAAAAEREIRRTVSA